MDLEKYNQHVAHGYDKEPEQVKRKTIDLEEFRKQINKRIKAKAQFGAPTDLQIAIDIAEELAHEN